MDKIKVVILLMIISSLSANLISSLSIQGKIEKVNSKIIPKKIISINENNENSLITGTGKVQSCEWTMGSEICGNCYQIRTPKGWEIVDYSKVGDLKQYVGKTVRYKGSRSQAGKVCSKMCPCNIVLYSIEEINMNCGDGICDHSIGEYGWTCPEDCCKGYCGDGVCNIQTRTCMVYNETPENCPQDCKEVIKIGNISAITSKEVEIENKKVYINTSKGRKLIKIMPNTAAKRAIEIANLHYIKGVKLKEVGRRIIYEINGTRKAYAYRNFPVNISIKIQINAENGTIEKILSKENKKLINLANKNIILSKNISKGNNITIRIVNRIMTQELVRIRNKNAESIRMNDTEFLKKLEGINNSIKWQREIKHMNSKFKRIFYFMLKNSTDKEKRKLKLQIHNYAKNIKNKKIVEKIKILNKIKTKKINEIREMLRGNVISIKEILNKLSN